MKQTILKRSCHVIIEFLVHVAPEPSCSETRFLPVKDKLEYITFET